MKFFLRAALIAGLFFAATVARAQPFSQLLLDPSVRGASVGIVVVDLDTGETLYEKDRMRAFIPASNEKLLTGSMAMLLLGTEYRFRTEFYTLGMQGGAARGLFVQGYGDPSLSEEFYMSNGAAIDSVAAQLVSQGLRRVDGDIVLDDTFFPPESGVPTGWPKDDLQYCYAPRPGPLSVAENCLKVTATGTSRGSAAAISTDPPLDPARVKNKVVTSRGSSVRVTEAADGNVVVSGSVSPGRSATIEHPVSRASLLYGNALSGALRRMGVPVSGRIVLFRSEKTRIDGYAHFATVSSPPLSMILTEMQRHSDNFIAEQVLRTLGGGRNGGSTRAGAEIIMQTMYKQRYAAPYFLRTFDGSGLSRSNRLTPDILINLLSGMYHSGYRDAMLATLASPGIDGTMEKRLVGTAAQGRVWAKTGALKGACSLSGYFVRANGHMGAFTMLFNDYRVHSNSIRALQDKLVLEMLGL